LRHGGEAKPSVPESASAIEHKLASISGELSFEEGAEAGGKSLEMGVEFDRSALEDEHRLEDPSAGIGVERREHAGIS
jgi:hypothetical protein